MIKKLLTGLATGMVLLTTLSVAEEATVVADETANTTKTGYTQAEIAEMVNNPLSYLWMLAVQNDTTWMNGDIPGADKIVTNVTTMMPVMPMQLTDDYKLIVRPWISMMNFKLPWGNQENFSYDSNAISDKNPYGTSGITNTSYHTGIGDVGMWAALASNEAAEPPFVWGVGITTMFNTASEDQFGTGKNSAGPMGLAFYIGEKWILGLLGQQWWSYSGDDERDNVNLTNIQYIVQYRLTEETNIGMSPNYTYDWKTDTYDLPVGGGVNTLIKIGELPVKILVEGYYHIQNQPNALYNKWHARVLFVPILPSPAWAKKSLF